MKTLNDKNRITMVERLHYNNNETLNEINNNPDWKVKLQKTGETCNLNEEDLRQRETTHSSLIKMKIHEEAYTEIIEREGENKTEFCNL